MTVMSVEAQRCRNGKNVRAKLDLPATVWHGTSDDDRGDQAHLLEDGVGHLVDKDCRTVNVADSGGGN